MADVAVPPLVGLLIGVLFGFWVQYVAARLRYNGEWEKIPVDKRIAMFSTGSIAAFLVGLWILDNPRALQSPGSGTPTVYRLWFWQTVAAWGGAVVLDVATSALNRWIRGRK